jgi:hypothetical protein
MHTRYAEVEERVRTSAILPFRVVRCHSASEVRPACLFLTSDGIEVSHLTNDTEQQRRARCPHLSVYAVSDSTKL